MVFHKSNYGMFGVHFIADMDGYVAISASDVVNLRWSDEVDAENANEIALHNHYVLAAATDKLTDFRN